MRKPDDDLKINISELFGGELPGPSDTVDDISESQAPGKPVAAPVERESQFKEWMVGRNQELEAKTQELEKRLQELKDQRPVDAGSDRLSAQELQTPPPSPETPKEPEPDSPIDFNAPIAPPFRGGVPAPTAVPEAPLEAAPAPGNTPVAEASNAGELKKLQAEYEFLMLYDEFRNIILYELKDLVGERKTFTMLVRTFELAREKHPEIFRNANWDPSGNLLEDGSVDSQRLLENKNALEASKADAVLDAALSVLLSLRLQAVEKGLGTGLKNKVRAHLAQWITEKLQKAAREGKSTFYLKRLSEYLS